MAGVNLDYLTRIIGVQWSGANTFVLGDGFSFVHRSTDGVNFSDRGEWGGAEEVPDSISGTMLGIHRVVYDRRRKAFFATGHWRQLAFEDIPVVIRSLDGGVTWHVVRRSPTEAGDWLWYDDEENLLVLRVTEDGVKKYRTSDDGGASWSAGGAGPVNEFIRCTLEDYRHRGDTVRVRVRMVSPYPRGQQAIADDPSPSSRVQISRDDGNSWDDFETRLEANGEYYSGVHAITFGKGLLVAVGYGGIAVSRDGFSWNKAVSLPTSGPVSETAWCAGYARGRFVVAGGLSEGDSAAAYLSSDGLSWKKVSTVQLTGYFHKIETVAVGITPR